MSAPGTFSLNAVYRALGVKSAIMPNYGVSQMNPVAIVADFSNTYAPEQIEGRAIEQVLWAVVAGANFHEYQLAVRAPGGAVIEALAIGSDVANLQGWYEILPTPTAGMAPAPAAVDIGGVPTGSVLSRMTPGAGPAGVNAIYPLPLTVPTDRMYVPTGSYLHWGTRSWPAPVVHQFHSFIVFREIQESLGSP